MAITDWPIDERPREKLVKHGSQALSDAELLAIFLRSGVPGKTAVDIARDLLQKFNGLRGILDADVSTFCSQHGLGLAKYVQLQASLEIVRRHLYTSLQTGQIVKDPFQAAAYLQSKLRGLKQEVFACLFLDNQHRVLAYEELFFGGIRDITVHPREVVRRALRYNSAAMILAHNHPSGSAAPSEADKILTTQLKAVLSLVEVKVLDHIIIGDGQLFSFLQQGLLD